MNTLEISGRNSRQNIPMEGTGEAELSIEHYILVLLHRKWLVLGIFLLVSAGTAIVSYYLPNIYTSETLILVDPQQVPGAYVQPTVTGDVRNRLSTLSQQILSATRLQKIIDTFNLYSDEGEKLHREDVITLMRKDITVNVVSEPSERQSQDLQAFKISYSGKDPRTTAQVTNELASLFIEENLKTRERIATGTTSFLKNQLDETRNKLEVLEAKIRDFKMTHLGEMPEQQQSNIQILGQLQSRLQVLSDSLYRAEQQRNYLQTLASAQPAPAQHPDTPQISAQPNVENVRTTAPSPTEAKLSELLSRYGENHPDVKRLRRQVEEERREREKAAQETRRSSPPPVTAAPEPHHEIPQIPQNSIPPAVQAQLVSLEAEIAKGKEDQQQLIKEISSYQKKLEAEPVREQEIADLIRDYAISKEHYSQLLEKQLSAEMATQLEIRQQGEKFTILDPAQVPQKPSRPNRLIINAGGASGGLALGLAVALAPEFLGTSLILPPEVGMAAGVAVLGVIPIISTPYDRRRRKRWMLAGATGGLAMLLAVCAFLFYRYRGQIF